MNAIVKSAVVAKSAARKSRAKNKAAVKVEPVLTVVENEVAVVETAVEAEPVVETAVEAESVVETSEESVVESDAAEEAAAEEATNSMAADPGAVLRSVMAAIVGAPAAKAAEGGEEAAEGWKWPKAEDFVRVPRSRSESIAISWLDNETRAKRLTKDGVFVTDSATKLKVGYTSTRDAFNKLALPGNKCISFRQGLKKNRSAVFSFEGVDYLFEMEGSMVGVEVETAAE